MPRTLPKKEIIRKKTSELKSIDIKEFISNWQPIFIDSAVLLETQQFNALMRAKGIYTKGKDKQTNEYLNVPHPAYVAKGFFTWEHKSLGQIVKSRSVKITKKGFYFLVENLNNSNIVSLRKFKELEPNKKPVRLLKI